MVVSPAARRTLAQAIAAADRTVTVLDDKIEVEDKAVFRWLRGHELHSNHFHHLVIGSQPLPVAWQAEAKGFASEADAIHLLRPVAHDPIAMRALRTALQELDPRLTGARDADLLAQAASALFSCRLWAIEARHAPHSRFVSRTTPSVFAPINSRLGTAVDFQYIATLEGNQWLRGYIPIKRSGVVAGRSGMTVASGFDVGQWSPAQLSAFLFPPALLAKLKPFANEPFKGLTKEQAAARVAKLGPVPILTKPEADLCDGAVFAQILAGAITAWDRRSSPGVVNFRQLPTGWQTVWLSRYYQEGPATHVALGKVFRHQALAGQWTEAIAALRGYSEYKARASAEADVLEAELPPAACSPSKEKKP